MKIGINLIPLRPGKNGGMEVYLRNLLEQLFLIDNVNQYYLITAPYNDSTLNYSAPNCKKLRIHEGRGLIDLTSGLLSKFIPSHTYVDDPMTRIIKDNKIDLWFCPFLSLDPRPLNIPSIVTIPDLQHEYFPDYFSKEELELRRDYIQPSCEQATKIITISQFSKQSFIEKLGIKPEKIEVIYLAAGDNFGKNTDDQKKILNKYNLPEYYLLYPANAWPHKNHLNLIKGFNHYKKIYNDSLHLVLTGSDLKNNIAINDLISQYNLKESVHILNYIDKGDMPELFKNAKALIFPSLFEGFGIPLLEAMTVGCPVIASDTTSIPEIADNAAYLFEPTDPLSICDAIHKIVADEPLREELVSRGKERAILYSYEKVARMHLDLFTSVYNQYKDSNNSLKNECHYFHGLYSDGWFSKMKFVYCGKKRFRHLHIDLRSELPVKYPMKISIILNDKKINAIIPSLGIHSFDFEIPDIETTNTEYKIEIISKYSYSPKKLGINDDERKISIILDSLIMIDFNENSTEYVQRKVK
ncbi:glycosyltransferase family 4 protein [Methanomicrobium antiquum]|uniref:Glycosyltransferase family 4 protein n=1 Tax=Methanomicrobium antiquum TaxID=487686 RepID=A0AAF0JM47_9EURY|nr:glycosyltransferase family 1 protein [Methanomicrobium antiquum]WFN36777.1 glycosyltransferase family 4 protein [Methanomicrobium antiquum]